MKIRYPGYILPVIFILCSCTNKNDDLRKRELHLLQREADFRAKEHEYHQLISFRDSVLSSDTVSSEADFRVWPDSLAQIWTSKMVCRESSCKNYVIGDQRTEKWVFSKDSIGLIVNVIENEKMKRRLRAEILDSTIHLKADSDSTVAGKTVISATLDNVRRKVVKGTQLITGRDGCVAKFSVELNPALKK